jgi:hypothetical protein
MITWEVVDNSGVQVSISDEGRQRLADEQRMNRVDRLYVEIRLGAAAGAVIVIAGLVAKQLLGA